MSVQIIEGEPATLEEASQAHEAEAAKQVSDKAASRTRGPADA
jgi:hypothetical protein